MIITGRMPACGSGRPRAPPRGGAGRSGRTARPGSGPFQPFPGISGRAFIQRAHTHAQDAHPLRRELVVRRLHARDATSHRAAGHRLPPRPASSAPAGRPAAPLVKAMIGGIDVRGCAAPRSGADWRGSPLPACGMRCTVVIRFRTESNGTSATRSKVRRDRPCGCRTPPRPAPARPSVGSPTAREVVAGVSGGPARRRCRARPRPAAGRASGISAPWSACAVRPRSSDRCPHPGAGEANAMVGDVDRGDRHAVLGQRAGLVRADHADRAQRLHRRAACGSAPGA